MLSQLRRGYSKYNLEGRDKIFTDYSRLGDMPIILSFVITVHTNKKAGTLTD